MLGEFSWQGQRLVVAHQPDLAAELTARRDARIAELEAEAGRLAGKLDGQDGGRRYKGRQVSDSGAKARFYQVVCEAKRASIIKVDLRSDLFTYEIDERSLARARMMDGKLILVTNVREPAAADVVARYKALADIERGFLALVLYRVLRMRLKDRGGLYSPERALEIARRIQFHQVTLHQQHTASGLATLSAEQKELFDALNFPTPTADAV